MKQKEKAENRIVWIVAGCVTIAYFLILLFRYDILFEINDDVMLESILSGSYLRPYAFTYYFSMELGAVLSSLYRICPMIPWFGLFYLFCNMFCVFSLAKLSLQKGRNALEKGVLVLFCLGAVTALCVKSFVLLHYTVLAAVLGAAGLAGLFLSEKKRDLILPFVQIFLCYLVRENVFFMLVPLIGIAFLLRLSEEGGKVWKEYRMAVLVFCGTFAVLFLGNRLLPTGADAAAYRIYNEERTKVYDFVGICQDEEALSYYIQVGFPLEDLELFRSYNIGLFGGEDGNQNGLRFLLAYSESRQDSFLSRAPKAAEAYLYRFLKQADDRPFNYAAMVLYAGCFLILFLQKKWQQGGLVVLLFLYRSLLWSYLFYKGRYPERVTHSVYIMELTLLLLLFCRQLWNCKKKEVCLGFLVLLMLGSGLLGVGAVKDLNAEYEDKQQVNRMYAPLFSYMEEHPDSFYFLDVSAVLHHTKGAFAVQGINTENYMWLGGWMQQQPLQKEKYRSRFSGAANARDALLTKEDTYLVLKEGVGLTEEKVQIILRVSVILTDTVECDGARYRIYRLEGVK